MKHYYVTTPIYYVNSKPHIGHVYTSVSADFLARFKRLDGYDVFFLTGTDEHGQKISQSAEEVHLTPQEFVDDIHLYFKGMSKLFCISEDDFIRTTQERHKKFVRNLWELLVKKGYIYLGEYSGWYSLRDEAFYSESELIDGKAPTGAEVKWISEPSYFFKLSAFSDRLLRHYEDNKEAILPISRRNEVLSFIKDGLEDLSISRIAVDWGISVPKDEQHTIYVWIDALSNYLSALGEKINKYWPCDLHLVGKDVLRFHAVYWPCILMAADLELPKQIFAHGWWTNEGEKMSKSLNNAILPETLVEEFGYEYVRYFLLKEMPFGSDGDYSKEKFIKRVNSELVNNIGNLTFRVLSFVKQFNDNRIPAVSDDPLLENAYTAVERMRSYVNSLELDKAIDEIVELGRKANEYIDTHAPWKLRSSNPEKMREVLFILLEMIRVIGILLQPILPDKAGKLLDQLGVSKDKRLFKYIREKLIEGERLKELEVLFPRLEK